MSGFLAAYQALFNLFLINALLAVSQYLVLRAGVFSMATVGFASLGAYAAALLMVRLECPTVLAVLAGGLVGLGCGLLLCLPLVRLRGVFQAIATLAFVQIVLSVALYAESVTGGATGFNGIPKTIGTWQLLLAVAVVLYLVAAIDRAPLGRAFDTIRQDETAAVALGINVTRTHAVAFGLSGFVAGMTGALMAGHNYSVVPEEFGFGMLVAVLSFVVLGGRQSLWGPVVGSLILTFLPELSRPLADYRMIVYGALLMAAIIYLPHGLVDTLLMHRLRARQARGTAAAPLTKQAEAR